MAHVSAIVMGSKMKWWIYKCNATVRGDWDYFFDHPCTEWGSTKDIPLLAQLAPGDKIIAYQTDRNELVGVAVVSRFRKKGRFLELYLEPIEEIRTEVRPLKQDAEVAGIEALTSAARKTLHAMSPREATALLRAARRAQLASS
jgi:hypothetical protein